MLEQIHETVAFIKSKVTEQPQIGIVLGTGLGNLANEIDVDVKFPYNEIPNFPVSTVAGHTGNLVFGKLNGVQVVALQGRFHFYEGYTMDQVVFPIRVMKLLGISSLLLSNASGGVNPDFEIGDIMLIDDHINLIPANPLIGKNIDELGPRFPDMSQPYNKSINDKIKQIASANNIDLQEGIYAAMSGPTYETPAEYQYVRNIGADAVGMSTVPEVIVANHMKLPCAAMSIITDLGVKGKIVEITHEEVQEISKAKEPLMTKIIMDLVPMLVGENIDA